MVKTRWRAKSGERNSKTMALSRCSLPASTPGCASATSGADDDLATIGAPSFLILDAGFGKDTLSLASGVSLDLSTLGHSRLTGFEVIDLVGSFTFHAQQQRGHRHPDPERHQRRLMGDEQKDSVAGNSRSPMNILLALLVGGMLIYFLLPGLWIPIIDKFFFS